MSRLFKAAAKLAYENPDLRDSLVPLLRKCAEDPETTDIYPHKMDHGWVEPLAGGSDIMRRVQNQFRHEQGLPTRPDSETVPKVASKDLRETDALRDSYYEMSDGAISFQRAVRYDPVTEGDRRLHNLVKEAVQVVSQIHGHLNRSYLWD
jgi:hypothetical protein